MRHCGIKRGITQGNNLSWIPKINFGMFGKFGVQGILLEYPHFNLLQSVIPLHAPCLLIRTIYAVRNNKSIIQI